MLVRIRIQAINRRNAGFYSERSLCNPCPSDGKERPALSEKSSGGVGGTKDKSHKVRGLKGGLKGNEGLLKTDLMEAVPRVAEDLPSSLGMTVILRLLLG